MEKEELEKCLQDMQEALSSLNKRNQPTKDLATEAKVNSAKCLEEVRVMDGNIKGLTALVKESKSIGQTQQLLIKMEDINCNIQLYADSLKDTLKRFPSRTKTDVSLRFEGRNRTIFFVVTGLLLLAALFAGLWSSAWQHDRRLKENDIKYRYLMLQIPAATLQTDTLYNNNPRQFKVRLEQMEAYSRVQQQAETIAAEKEKEAKAARQNIQKLKKAK